MNTIKCLMLLGLVGVLAGCKLIVAAGEGGSLLSGSGSNNCGENSFCEIQISDTNFSDTFTAIPKTGYVFSRWEEGNGFFCGNSTNATCTLDNTGLAGNASVDALIATNRTFYIRPIFNPVSGYLGMTSANYDGSPLLSGWTAACQADYGSQAVVCNTKQILESPSLASMVVPSGGLWVKIVVVGGDAGYWVDYSGLRSNMLPRCLDGSAFNAPYLKPDFHVGSVLCNTARPIACCR